MPANLHDKLACFLGLFLVGAASLALTACQSPGGSTGRHNGQTTAAAAPDQARVWAENCGRCHFLRPPNEFSYDQWEVIVQHMRLRATLPASETRAILEFLKAANQSSQPGTELVE